MTDAPKLSDLPIPAGAGVSANDHRRHPGLQATKPVEGEKVH